MSLSSLFAPNSYDIHARSIIISGAAQNSAVVCESLLPQTPQGPPEKFIQPVETASGAFPDTTEWVWTLGTDTNPPIIEGVWTRIGGVVSCDIIARGLGAKAGKTSEVAATLRPLPHKAKWLTGTALVLGNHTDVHATVSLGDDGLRISFDGTICCGDVSVHLSYLVD